MRARSASLPVGESSSAIPCLSKVDFHRLVPIGILGVPPCLEQRFILPAVPPWFAPVSIAACQILLAGRVRGDSISRERFEFPPYRDPARPLRLLTLVSLVFLTIPSRIASSEEAFRLPDASGGFHCDSTNLEIGSLIWWWAAAASASGLVEFVQFW